MPEGTKPRNHVMSCLQDKHCACQRTEAHRRHVMQAFCLSSPTSKAWGLIERAHAGECAGRQASGCLPCGGCTSTGSCRSHSCTATHGRTQSCVHMMHTAQVQRPLRTHNCRLGQATAAPAWQHKHKPRPLIPNIFTRCTCCHTAKRQHHRAGELHSTPAAGTPLSTGMAHAWPVPWRDAWASLLDFASQVHKKVEAELLNIYGLRSTLICSPGSMNGSTIKEHTQGNTCRVPQPAQHPSTHQYA